MAKQKKGLKVKLLSEIRKSIYVSKKRMDELGFERGVEFYEVVSETKTSIPFRTLCVDIEQAKVILRTYRLKAAREMMPATKKRIVKENERLNL